MRCPDRGWSFSGRGCRWIHSGWSDKWAYRRWAGYFHSHTAREKRGGKNAFMLLLCLWETCWNTHTHTQPPAPLTHTHLADPQRWLTARQSLAMCRLSWDESRSIRRNSFRSIFDLLSQRRPSRSASAKAPCRPSHKSHRRSTEPSELPGTEGQTHFSKKPHRVQEEKLRKAYLVLCMSTINLYEKMKKFLLWETSVSISGQIQKTIRQQAADAEEEKGWSVFLVFLRQNKRFPCTHNRPLPPEAEHRLTLLTPLRVFHRLSTVFYAWARRPLVQ